MLAERREGGKNRQLAERMDAFMDEWTEVYVGRWREEEGKEEE